MLRFDLRLKDEELKTKDGYDKHIYCEGARQHVLSWGTNGVTCSEKNCVVNRDKQTPGFREAIFLE